MGIYRTLLEEEIKNNIADAIENHDANENEQIRAQNAEFDDTDGSVDDILEESVIAIYEYNSSINELLKEFSICELNANISGEPILEAFSLKSFFEKVKEFFKKFFSKIKEVINNLASSIFKKAVGNEAFYNKNKKVIELGYDKLKEAYKIDGAEILPEIYLTDTYTHEKGAVEFRDFKKRVFESHEYQYFGRSGVSQGNLVDIDELIKAILDKSKSMESRISGDYEGLMALVLGKDLLMSQISHMFDGLKDVQDRFDYVINNKKPEEFNPLEVSSEDIKTGILGEKIHALMAPDDIEFIFKNSDKMKKIIEGIQKSISSDMDTAIKNIDMVEKAVTEEISKGNDTSDNVFIQRNCTEAVKLIKSINTVFEKYKVVYAQCIGIIIPQCKMCCIKYIEAANKYSDNSELRKAKSKIPTKKSDFAITRQKNKDLEQKGLDKAFEKYAKDL